MFEKPCHSLMRAPYAGDVIAKIVELQVFTVARCSLRWGHFSRLVPEWGLLLIPLVLRGSKGCMKRGELNPTAGLSTLSSKNCMHIERVHLR